MNILRKFIQKFQNKKPHTEEAPKFQKADQEDHVMSEEEMLDETIAESMIASDPPGHISKSIEDKNLH